jgi:hypothetical protein
VPIVKLIWLINMMDKIFKNIRIIILLVAGLAIIGHMIIPHDHHPADSIACQDDSCPVSNNRSDHHSGLPVHCHVCNDLASEKASLLLTIRIIQSEFFIINSDLALSSDILSSTGTGITDISRFPYKSDVPDLLQLRAPPSFS